MPREYVHGRWPLVAEQDGGAVVEGLVSVGWSEETVQVATTSRQASTFEVINEGLYVDLDRRGINKLIRDLRRARDQAYGRDE